MRHAVIGREGVVEWAPSREAAEAWAAYSHPQSALASTYVGAAVYNEDEISRLTVWDNNEEAA